MIACFNTGQDHMWKGSAWDLNQLPCAACSTSNFDKITRSHLPHNAVTTFGAVTKAVTLHVMFHQIKHVTKGSSGFITAKSKTTQLLLLGIKTLNASSTEYTSNAYATCTKQWFACKSLWSFKWSSCLSEHANCHCSWLKQIAENDLPYQTDRASKLRLILLRIKIQHASV